MADDNFNESIPFNRTEMPGLILRYVLMIGLLIVFVGPFLWLLSISLRGSENVYSFNLIPKDPTLENFVHTWKAFGFARAFANSVFVAVLVVACNILFCSMAAYPLARIKFPGSQFVFFLILSTMMIPFQLNMVPLYLLCLKLRLTDSYLGLVIPGAVGAFGIYLVKQYYQTIPKDLEEAARIDGAGEFGIWWRIMFPLTKPAIAAMAIFVFVANWSSFLWPLIILDDEKKFTLPIAVAKLSGAFVDRTQYIAAGSVIAVLPIIIFFFFLQRYFIGGLTLGSVKG